MSSLETVMGVARGNMNTLVFWLANICRFKNHLHQYSGQQQVSHTSNYHTHISVFGTTPYHRSSLFQNLESSLVNFDLSEYNQMLTQQAKAFYHQIVDLVHSQLSPLIGQLRWQTAGRKRGERREEGNG